MYKRDKAILFLILVVACSIAYFFAFDFFNIASETISLVALALTVYSIALTSLSGESKLAVYMRKTVDPSSNGERTQIGTLNVYIKVALFFGIATIITAAIFLVLHDERWLQKLYLMSWRNRVLGLRNPYKGFSAMSFGLFSCNFFFVYKIITFILNRATYNS